MKSLIEKNYLEMEKNREFLHQNPEVGNNLPITSEFVRKHLEKLGLEVHTGFYKTGVVGILRGEKAGKTVMLRADMDALPIKENADVPYKSKKENMMHACAHDGHTAALMGAASVLTEMKKDISGNVMFLFQPAEESDYGGAKFMIEEGVLDLLPIEASFAAHLWGPLKKGEISIKPGIAMASRDEFYIKLIGRGGHGAVPSEAIDPIIMATQIINSFQSIISRNISANDSVVLSICELNTPKGASNIIPDYIEMTGTLRAYDADIRELMIQKIHTTLGHICELHGGTYEFKFTGGYPELINNPTISKLAIESAKKVVGDKNVIIPEKAASGSEDYAYFCQKVPSCMAFIGISDENSCGIHHNPNFKWNSDAMKPLTEYLCTVALDFLKQ